MSLRVMTLVWDRSEAKGSDRMILLAIADVADDEGYAFPSFDYLAAKSNLSKRAVQYSVKRLLGGDELELLRSGAKGRSNEYRVSTQSLRRKESRLPRFDANGDRIRRKMEQDSTQPTATEPSGNRKEPSGNSSPSQRPTGSQDPESAKEFEEWLSFHAFVTGHKPPGPKTQVFKQLRKSFEARRREDYSLDDLKLAVRGAWADDFRRERGYTTAESVLRPSKVYGLICRGRQLQPDTDGESPQAAHDRERKEAGLD